MTKISLKPSKMTRMPLEPKKIIKILLEAKKDQMTLIFFFLNKKTNIPLKLKNDSMPLNVKNC